MNDAEKLQLIRMKVEELQDDLAGRKSRRRAARAAAAPPPPPPQVQPQVQQPEVQQPAQPPAEDMSGRKGRSFEPGGPGGEPGPGPGGEPGPGPGGESEEMGDGIEYTGNPYGELDYLPDDDNMVDDDFSNGVVDAGMGDISVGVGQSSMTPVLGVIGLLSSGLSAYHGYRRNDSIGWGIGWGVLGAVFPIITPAIAFAQGFGQPADRPLRANDGDEVDVEEELEDEDGEVDVEEFEAEDEDEPVE